MMKFSATTIVMALSLSKTVKLASAEGAETSSISWEGEIAYNMYTDKNCTDPLVPNTNSTVPLRNFFSVKALGNNMLCLNELFPLVGMNNIVKAAIKCDTTGSYEDYFLLSYNPCFDDKCRNCSDTVQGGTLEPKTNWFYTPYSCDPLRYVNMTTGTGELSGPVYGQHYASPEVMASYMEPFATTCIGDYVKSSSSSSTPNYMEAASTNENDGMLNDGSGAITGEEGGSSVGITWGVSPFVVLATAGLSTILFE
jgi:hypothetical protein